MRVLHTADWHIGQTLNGWSRDLEHAAWFDALARVIVEREIDVLLIAGDVYDGINPSGRSQHLLYSALRRFKDARPSLVTVMTSGNHDPVGRLEAPSAVLEALDVHVVGTLRRSADEIDVAHHMIPLPDATGEIRAWACAVPFLRAADLPGLSFSVNESRTSPIVDAARRLHLEMARSARDHAGDLPVIAMGHLHCHGATESDGAERRILIGGEHAVPENVFPEDLDYVALGHLHRPQSLDGGRIRYAGSCFPLSAAEIAYDHGVTVIDIDEDGLRHEHVPIDRPVEMIRLPERGAMSFEDFELALDGIEVDEGLPSGLHPFIYVNLEADGPASVLMTEAEKLLSGRDLRIANIRVRRDAAREEGPAPISLRDTTPEDLFIDAFLRVTGVPADDAHVAAFREAVAEV